MAYVSSKAFVDEPCINLASQVRKAAQNPAVAIDIALTLVQDYLELVELLTARESVIYRQEYAYGRLLGTRGALCRLCPQSLVETLPEPILHDWKNAELLLQDYLARSRGDGRLIEAAMNVEARWTDSAERFMKVIFYQLEDAEVPEQLGFLKGIDTIALHIAQRELFRATGLLVLPLENANAVKLRMRLLSLYLTLHRSYFMRAFPAIQSYRETFRITDPLAYPWWFVDCVLTERQLNWTYRRLAERDMNWRFS